MPALPRSALVAWAVLCSCGWAAEFPYTEHIASHQAEVRSGPGEKYYPVLKLQRGETIEVYRHDPGGWYAIRPPDQSFSWVAAEFIEPAEGNLGIVTGDQVAARVGTLLNDTRDVIQVRLDRGEQVQILELRELDTSAGPQTWYKIAPPAGEFRWVSAKDVDGELAKPRHSAADAADDLPRPKHRRHEAADDEEDWKSDPAPEPQPRRRPKRHAKQDDEANDDGIDEQELAEELSPGRVHSRLARRTPKADLREEAVELDLALSAMVAEDTRDWDFTILRRQADAALARAESGLERGRIRRVLRKIDNFADIQQRYTAVMRQPDREGSRLSRRLNSSDSAHLSSLGGSNRASHFDGQGRLTQITTADPNDPHFALLDAAGQVAAYVSPAPGVNLRRYLNQEVGINGTRGYLADRQARTLTARRIETLSDTRLR
ncbi:MAG TPA: SH3 domain-containing protein [Pirellulales bacterium]